MLRVTGFGPRRTLMYVVPLAALTAGGLVFGNSLIGSSPDSARASAPITASPAGTPSAVPTTAASIEAAEVGSTATAPVRSLGVKKGTIALAGPAPAAKNATVIFVLDGPQRLIKTDTKAPFTVRVNTRALRNGNYTLTTVLLQRGTSSVATTSSLRIKNVAATSGKTAKTPTSTKKQTGSNSGSGGGSTQPVAAGPAAADNGFASEVLSLVNVERAKVRCKPLTLNGKLNAAAQAHTTDMATHNFFSHNSQDGRTPFDRITAAGYAYSAAAENIAAGSSTAAAVMNQWMNSPGHKANILNCQYTELGVGYAKGVNAEYGTYWTQDFGTPR